MATINPTVTRPSDDSMKVVWANFSDADTLVAFKGLSEYADRSVYVGGTFDSATVLIQGSNDGTNFVTLVDPQGNALSFTAAGQEQILEYVESLKPSTSGGSTSEDITVTVYAKRIRRG